MAKIFAFPKDAKERDGLAATIAEPKTSPEGKAGYLSDRKNFEQLASQMSDFDQSMFKSFGHCQFEAAFKDRIFVIYQPAGGNNENSYREPEILTHVKVIDFTCTSSSGAHLRIQDMATGGELSVGYVPTRLWGYKVFLQVPPVMQLKWDAQQLHNGELKRSLLFGVLIKTANRSDFCSTGNTYCLPPNKLKKLYPAIELILHN